MFRNCMEQTRQETALQLIRDFKMHLDQMGHGLNLRGSVVWSNDFDALVVS
jgi:hypothetical protein